MKSGMICLSAQNDMKPKCPNLGDALIRAGSRSLGIESAACTLIVRVFSLADELH